VFYVSMNILNNRRVRKVGWVRLGIVSNSGIHAHCFFKCVQLKYGKVALMFDAVLCQMPAHGRLFIDVKLILSDF